MAEFVERLKNSGSVVEKPEQDNEHEDASGKFMNAIKRLTRRSGARGG